MSPPLLARGKLAQTSLPEFLVYAHDHVLAGTLVLQQTSGEKSAVLFVRGAPAKARLPVNNVFLGDVLVDLGLVERKACREAQMKAEELGRPHGELLRELGLVDDTGLYLGLREQLARQVLQLCRLPGETDFGFYGANYLAKYGPEGEWRVKPLPLVWRALVDHVPEPKVAGFLDRLGDRELRLRVDAPVARHRMTTEESALVSVMRARPQPLSALRDTGILPAPKVDRVIVALLLSRQLEGVNDTDEPVGAHEPPESPQSIPPRTLVTKKSSLAEGFSSGTLSSRAPPLATAESEEFRAELLAMRANPPKTLYELLGVPAEADMQTVRAAFFRNARRFHPDKLPSDLADLKDFVTTMFAKMGEAHQTLTDAAKRAEYDRSLEEGEPLDEEQAQVAAILDAASAYQRAEILVKKKDFAQALVEARMAMEGDPTQPDYIALHAWLASTQRSTDLEEFLADLDRALEIGPGNVRTLWYRGQLLKKMGKTMLAVRDFKKIVELKPGHVDAQRELRVFQMRKQTDPTGAPGRGTTQSRPSEPMRNERSTTGPRTTQSPEAKPSLFGRLLKKD